MLENINTPCNPMHQIVEEYFRNTGVDKEDILQLKKTKDGLLWFTFADVCNTVFNHLDQYSITDKALLTLFPYIFNYFKEINPSKTLQIYNEYCKYFDAKGQIQGY